MTYDFKTLSPADFEDLVRDLVGHELGMRFETFGAGPDGGIDGRHASGKKATILQAKHYVGSAFSTLASRLRRERRSIDRLAPSRYILATSRPLSPANKHALAGIVGPALVSEGDIFGQGDLNSLLRRFPEIEKTHIKLWLSGVAILERVVRSAAHAFTIISMEEIDAKVRVYAQNPSFKESRDKLERHHVLIISGPPGVGKATLAEMLSYAYIHEGWNFVAIRSLEDGFAKIIDSQRMIFFFDDFLGKIALDARALATKDSDLARFMKRVRTSPNARFILTTRAYIFEEARRVSEHLADQRLDVAKYLLDVGVYTRRIKARILYNHLLVAGTSKAHIKALIESNKIPKIVDHKNYNPRVVEWMTDKLHIADIEPEMYADAFLGALNNPRQLWDTAFRTHITVKCKHLLYALFFGSQYGVGTEDLRASYEVLHPLFCTKYCTAHDPKDFEEALRILEGGFIAINNGTTTFINPSLRDYLAEYLNDAGMLIDFASTSRKADWARAVWRHGVKGIAPDPEATRALASSFMEVAQKFTRLPIWQRSLHDSNAFGIWDLANTERISLLLEWWQASEDIRFAELALAVARNPVEDFTPWLDGEKIVKLVRQLPDEDYFEDFPYADELTECLESRLMAMLQTGMASDDLEKISDAIDDAGELVSPELSHAATDAIVREVEDVEAVAADIASESTLEDHIRALEKLAPRANVPSKILAKAVSTVRDRIAEVEKQTSVAASPSFSGPPSLESDDFNDTDLRNLFVPVSEG